MRTERGFAERLIDTAEVIVLVVDSEGRIVRYNFVAGRRLSREVGRAIQSTTDCADAEPVATQPSAVAGRDYELGLRRRALRPARGRAGLTG